MDMITLAMAKAYTDNKVGGGGSGGGLPNVELKTVATKENVSLTAEESAQMDALNGKPAVIKVTLDHIGEMCACFNSVKMAGITGYSASFGSLQVHLDGTDIDGEWTLYYST